LATGVADFARHVQHEHAHVTEQMMASIALIPLF